MDKSQGVLFPTSEPSKSFEFKRAEKEAKKEARGDKSDYYLKLPYTFNERQFLVSHSPNGFHCQACNGSKCSHITNLKNLLAYQNNSLITDVVMTLPPKTVPLVIRVPA
jgi:hypothetical protein